MRTTITAALLSGTLLLAGCDLDRENPNAPTQEATFSSADGIIALAVGLQNRLGSQQGSLIYAAGLVTDELAAVSAALVTISDAEGGVVTPGANLVGDMWGNGYRTIKTANDIIANVGNVSPIDPGTASGILALAYFGKAAALGDLLMTFEQVSLDSYESETPTFVGRDQALPEILSLLDLAEATLTAEPPSTQFNTTILARGFSLVNSIFAYRARYQRLAGNDAEAVAAADLVDRTVFSVLPYSELQRNPVNLFSTGSSGVAPRDAFRLAGLAEGETSRLTFHVTDAPTAGRIGPVDAYARYGVPSASVPVYYPDEVLLIKAEALANMDQLAHAQAVLDSVRTDCPGLVPNDPNACLPALPGPLTKAELIAEIYENRRFELFATGLRWEDLRRLGLVGADSEAKRCWLPYPVSERNANPVNVPVDPEGVAPPPSPAQCFP